MKAIRNICIITALCFAGLTVFAQTNVDLNIGPAGQFCGAQLPGELKCTINAFVEDSQGNYVSDTTVAFDLKKTGLSTVTINGTSYQVTSPFPTVLFPSYPQHPKATGTLDIVFTGGELVLPYSSDYQCNSGRVCAGREVMYVFGSTASLDGEGNDQ